MFSLRKLSVSKSFCQILTGWIITCAGYHGYIVEYGEVRTTFLSAFQVRFMIELGISSGLKNRLLTWFHPQLDLVCANDLERDFC